MAKLLIKSGPNQGAQIELPPGVFRVGRHDDNDFQIDDPSVSTHHCEMTIQEGSINVRDLGSTNGTYIDGQPIQEGILRPGQALHLGTVEMLYEAPARVRIAATTAASAPASQAPALPAGMSPCKTHPQNPAEWVCSRCHQLLCVSCVVTRQLRGKPVMLCNLCGGKCVPLGLGVFARPSETKSFFSGVPEAFVYPLKGNGVLLLIGGALFFGFLDFLRHPTVRIPFVLWAVQLLITVIGGGYLFSYMRRIVQSSAQGDEEMPSWPEFGDFWNDIISPFFQALITFGICFGPLQLLVATAAIQFAISQSVSPLIFLGLLGATVWAAGYFPMAMLAVAMADSLSGLNPLLVIPSIFRVPLEYLVTCCVLAAIVIVRILSEVVLGVAIRIPVVPALLAGFVSLYFLAVEMRLLGTLYLTNKDRLRWF